MFWHCSPYSQQKHAVICYGVGALGLHVDLLRVNRIFGKATTEYFKGGNLVFTRPNYSRVFCILLLCI